MLVLSRKNNEAFWVGGDVRIVVIEASEGRVKIGIEAPKSVSILREELLKTKTSDKN